MLRSRVARVRADELGAGLEDEVAGFLTGAMRDTTEEVKNAFRAEVPMMVGDLGQAIVRFGDPGEPEIDLSPPTWWWDRNFPIELAAKDEPGRPAREVLAEMAKQVGDAIQADPYLGGLCSWLDASAPVSGEVDQRGAAPIAWCDFAIIASYSTTSPLG